MSEDEPLDDFIARVRQSCDAFKETTGLEPNTLKMPESNPYNHRREELKYRVREAFNLNVIYVPDDYFTDHYNDFEVSELTPIIRRNFDGFYEFMDEVMGRQKIFQEVREDIDLDTLDDRERNRVAEAFLNRASQEIFELLKTQPEGVLGQKNPRELDRRETVGELSDVFLFLFNFMIVRKITFRELVEMIPEVQRNNFRKALEKIKRRQEEKERRVNEIFS